MYVHVPKVVITVNKTQVCASSRKMFYIFPVLQLFKESQFLKVEDLYNDGLRNSGSIQTVFFKQLFKA